MQLVKEKNDQSDEEGKVFKVIEHVFITKCQNKLNCSYQKSVYKIADITFIQYNGVAPSNCSCPKPKFIQEVNKILLDNISRPNNEVYLEYNHMFKTRKYFNYLMLKLRKSKNMIVNNVSYNAVDQICNLCNLVGKSNFIRFNFFNSGVLTEDKHDLQSLVLYFNDTILDIYSLAVNSSCTLFIDKTFDRSEYFITTISYKNTKIFRKSNKKIPIFHGLFLLHTSSKTEVFQQFFQHLKNLLSSVADVKGDSDAWKSNLFFVTDQEKAITSAIDKVFSNSQRILCSRHINENIKFKLESKV